MRRYTNPDLGGMDPRALAIEHMVLLDGEFFRYLSNSLEACDLIIDHVGHESATYVRRLSFQIG